MKQYYPTAPHPTPIATGKGKRTPAVDEDVFTDYLSKHLNVPDLSLPQYYCKPRRSRAAADDDDDDDDVLVLPSLNLSSLTSYSPRTLIISHAVELNAIRAAIADVGAFQIVNHGLSPDLKIGSATEEYYTRCPYALERRKSAGATDYCSAHHEMESLYIELEKIAKALSLVFDKILLMTTSGRRPPVAKIRTTSSKGSNSSSSSSSSTEPVLPLRIYKNHSDDEDDEDDDEVQNIDAFTLHLLPGDLSDLHLIIRRRMNTVINVARFKYCTKQTPVLLVTTGKQLREYCIEDDDEEQQRIRNSKGDLAITPSTDHRGPFVSIQLVCPLSVLAGEASGGGGGGGGGDCTTISIFDQILVLLLIALAYDFLKYLQNP
ncbi:hypothetical protein H6P81_016320 [Aristolochia fimbriata]|uniref:Non-haem dioxygenase N-terminal domain-containing protein n=1 Tax=Aristolochia fimbriata TaxID=158543 RepID=A0AAV7E7X6_ARIFI|nr:hypothetical protein H6P81_016320 [Aristolochia fimbriata]